MTTATTKAPTQRRLFTRELPVNLTDDENQRYGKMLAEKLKEQDLAEAKAKRIAIEEKAKIATIKTEIARIAAARRDGAELRPIECYEEFVNGAVHVIRTDKEPGEALAIVEIRPADYRDLQSTLPEFDNPPVEPGGGDVGPSGYASGEMTTSSVGDGVWSGETTPDHGESDDGTDGLTHADDGQEGAGNVLPFAQTPTTTQTNESSAPSGKRSRTSKPRSTESGRNASGSKNTTPAAAAAPAPDTKASSTTSKEPGQSWAERHYGKAGKATGAKPKERK